MKCKFNDCGWCYCESGKSNDDNGACNKPEDCEEYKLQPDGCGGIGGMLQGINVIADDFLPRKAMVVSRDIFESLNGERNDD